MHRFFLGAVERVQTYQPVQWTGVMAHTACWMMAGWCPDILPNPNFKKMALPLSSEKQEEKTESKSLPASPVKPIRIGCVHGTADRKSGLFQLAGRLQNNLPEQVEYIRLYSFEGRGRGLSIEAFAKQLINQILAEGSSDLILIGHSRGALVIEAALPELKKHGIRVHGIICIAGPYGGSWYAMRPVTLFSDSVAEMQLKSKFLERIHQQNKQCSIPRVYYAPENDHMVSVEATTIPEYRDKIKVISGHGHLSVLSSKRLAEMNKGDIKTFVSQALKQNVISLTYKDHVSSPKSEENFIFKEDRVKGPLLKSSL